MKNQPVPKGKFLKQFKDVVGRKNAGPQKTLLVNLAPAIGKRYARYVRSRKELESIVPEIWSVTESDALKSCYENSSRFHADLARARRIGARESDPDPICPYCQVDHARVWDHFLPSITFPEYFVFPPNLIRTCDDCNRKKLADSAFDRNFINPFFDEISEVRYLACTARRSAVQGRISATFRISADIANPLYDPYIEQIATRHFERLGLARKLAAESVRDISGILISARQWLPRPRDSDIRAVLQNQVKNLRDDGAGENDRHLVLREALLTLPTLL